MQERIGIAGSGAIACGLAVTAARNGDVLLWARSDASAERARATVCQDVREARRRGRSTPNACRSSTALDALADATFLVEAVVEHHGSKAAVLDRAGRAHAGAGGRASRPRRPRCRSTELARASGHPERFVGLHVFNPVTRMKLVELAFPPEAIAGTRERARALCDALGKTAVEVPDIPGFVVNRLLFPYLFSAVELMARPA